MANWAFTKGMHNLGNGCWGYVVPDGSWGWSNAGLVTDGDAALLVDTLFDLKLTGGMLADFRKSVPAAENIDILVNTHADGDHTFGNQLVKGARIIATEGTVRDFDRVHPSLFHKIATNAQEYGSAGVFFEECMRPFDHSNIELTPPTETFSGTLDLKVGDKDVRLIEVGPAHSLGDALIHVPKEKVVYTGDILFNEGTPIAWYGPVARWIDACNLLLKLDVEAVVPGHGPVCGKDEVRRMRDYLIHVTEQARPLYESGMDYLQAAYKIDLGEYRDWNDAERVVVTMQTLFDDFADLPQRPNRAPIPYFSEMKSFRHHLGKGTVHADYWACQHCGHDH